MLCESLCLSVMSRPVSELVSGMTTFCCFCGVTSPELFSVLLATSFAFFYPLLHLS